MTTTSVAQVIDRFTGTHSYLSNFSDYPVELDGVIYPTREHAFAAAKTDDPAARDTIQRAATPGAAKSLGRRVHLRPDWDRLHRVPAMYAILRSCFTRHPQLADQLLDTGDTLLIEGNDWADRFWGRAVARGSTAQVGWNMLGRSLMRLRSELRRDPETRWPRVALTGHRPQHIDTLGARDWVQAELARIATKLRDEHGTTIGLTGLALGSDTWWAQAADTAGLDLWGYAPFPQQADPWPRTDQDEYARLRALCTRLIEIGPRNRRHFYAARNGVMVVDSDAVIAVYDPEATSGGTIMTMQKFCLGMPLIRVDIRHRRVSLSQPFRGL
ncbi:NADAR domain-containing protein [Nocardia carnea]|uniref:NADAR domain-containing protein n=1 Tax=Nocardia carnea TaxID=37328 RepID=UPI0024552A39|nr:NADAR domain-containing protein [Nocardia carnea]